MDKQDVHTIEILGADWVEEFLYLDGKPFSLAHYPFYREIYNQAPRAMLLKTCRQVAKSTSISNLLVMNACLRPYWKQLFVAPSQEQTMRFSQSRYGRTLTQSPRLKNRWVALDETSRVFYKSFRNGAECTLSYASDNADRIRGISADEIFYDEVQDILYDEVIPVAAEVMSNSDYKFERFCGTPKTMENTIEKLWQWSTQTEWAVRCDACGKFGILNDEACLGRRGPICRGCGGYYNVRNGVWVDMRTFPDDYTGKRVKGFHISQFMLPRNVPASMPSDSQSQELALARWESILEKHATYPTTKFKNEVIGLSDSTGSRLITREELEAFCTDLVISEVPRYSNKYDFVSAGVDWSGGGATGQSRTVLWIWGVNRGLDYHRITLDTLYFKIFPDTNPISGGIVEEIMTRCRHFGVDLIIGDAGGGALANNYLQAAFGHKATQLQYKSSQGSGASSRGPVFWNKQDRYVGERTTLIDHYLAFVKNGGVRFAARAQMGEAFDHMLSVYEMETRTGMKIWNRTPGEPDDALHAQLFGWVAANMLTGNPLYLREVV